MEKENLNNLMQDSVEKKKENYSCLSIKENDAETKSVNVFS